MADDNPFRKTNKSEYEKRMSALHASLKKLSDHIEKAANSEGQALELKHEFAREAASFMYGSTMVGDALDLLHEISGLAVVKGRTCVLLVDPQSHGQREGDDGQAISATCTIAMTHSGVEDKHIAELVADMRDRVMECSNDDTGSTHAAKVRDAEDAVTNLMARIKAGDTTEGDDK